MKLLLKIGLTLSLLTALFLVIYNDIQSRKPPKCSCEREVQLRLDSRDEVIDRFQARMTEWNTRLQVENLVLRDRLRLYEELPPSM